MRYLFVIEKAADGYCGYYPDVPGMASAEDIVEQLLGSTRQGLAAHLEDQPAPAAHGLEWHLQHGLDLPPGDMLAWVEHQPQHHGEPVIA